MRFWRIQWLRIQVAALFAAWCVAVIVAGAYRLALGILARRFR